MGSGVQLPRRVLHSIPFRSGKEDVFYKFSDFFHNRQGQPQGKGQNTQKSGGQVGSQVAQAEQPGADGPEIEGSAGQTEGRAVQPDLPAPGILGPEEQPPRSRQPEQQVQYRPQGRDFHPHPQDAEQVVQHPHAAAQEQGLTQGPGLLGQIDAHPPSSRETSPPRDRFPSP